MTITERNNRLYDLRNDLYKAQMKVEAIKKEIIRVHGEYEMAQRELSGQTLFDDMFGG